VQDRPMNHWEQVASEVDWFNPTLSFRRLRESVYKNSVRLREANAESAFGQLLRAGIQTFAINSYNTVPVVYPDLVTEVTSRRYQEYYAPLFRPNLPKKVDRGQKFQDNPVKGLDRVLTNFKFGMIESFERELFDDDQTGQIKNRASQMGENFKIMEEIYVIGKILGTGFTVQGVEVDPANTQADVVPAGFGGTGTYNTSKGNVPFASGSPASVTFGRLNQPNLEAADIALMNITDDLGNKFLVSPNTLLVSSVDKFVAAKLLNSTLQPSVPTTAAGDTGYVMTVNPLQGLYKLLVSRFMVSKAWILGDPKKCMVFQRRDPLEIIQEQPASGQSFDQEVYRFKSRSRFEVGIIDSRFLFEGDDGTV
jgi:hypothetical protein